MANAQPASASSNHNLCDAGWPRLPHALANDKRWADQISQLLTVIGIHIGCNGVYTMHCVAIRIEKARSRSG
jgi:hypothetical protein